MQVALVIIVKNGFNVVLDFMVALANPNATIF
jgi:hypothetical protein